MCGQWNLLRSNRTIAMHFITATINGDTVSSILYYNAQLIFVPQWCLLWLHLLDRKSKRCNVNTRVQEMYRQFTVYSTTHCTSLVYIPRPETEATPAPIMQEMYWQFTVYSISLSSLASFPGLRLRLLLLPRHTTNVSSCHKTLYSCMLPAMFVFCYQ